MAKVLCIALVVIVLMSAGFLMASVAIPPPWNTLAPMAVGMLGTLGVGGVMRLDE